MLLHVTPTDCCNDSCGSHPVSLRLVDFATCYPVVCCISRGVLTSHWSGSCNQLLSDLRVRFHLNRCHQTHVCLEPVSCTDPQAPGVDEETIQEPNCLGKYALCCTRLFFASVHQQLLEICLVQAFGCLVPAICCCDKPDVRMSQWRPRIFSSSVIVEF